MSDFDGIAKIKAASLKAMSVGVATSPAQEFNNPMVDDAGRQMALFVAQHNYSGEPYISVGIVLGGTQFVATLTAAQSDQFCHAIADAVLWQNDQLRQKAGQAVH